MLRRSFAEQLPFISTEVRQDEILSSEREAWGINDEILLSARGAWVAGNLLHGVASQLS